ncbi:MAG TPA: FAD-dependent oxidoreductase, partial [Gemmatimonadales bacterium]|nr:FAD-dependent oxidoreductase [Gemmatimonadales bacterium]
MTKTKYGRSPWLDQFPKSRVPSYPRHRGTEPVDVVIIGGGLTGCATAYAFAVAGAKVMLLEAEQIGRGATALSSGWISEDPGVPFGDLEKA